MNSTDHAKLLRDAIATSAKYGRNDVADMTGRSYRTVSNWVSTTQPTMPEDKDKAILRRMFPGYDSSGDAVETALHRSPLIEWRRLRVLSFYKQQLSEQADSGEKRADSA